jgi:hypothetical protein
MRKPSWEADYGKRELEELQERFPSLRFNAPSGEGNAVITGTFPVAPDVGYTTALEVSRAYPSELPILYCDPVEIPWELDRHVVTQSGHACLCARSEYGFHWPEGSSLSDFIERLVKPFFLGQFYYDTHGCWPPTGARSHGWHGIIEAYVDLCAPMGDTSLETIFRVMRLLSRKNDPQGHEICPCGSGRPLRQCHRIVVLDLRRRVRPQDAVTDLSHLSTFARRRNAA